MLPTGLQDLTAAIRWLRTNARVCQLDRSRIEAQGASASDCYVLVLCLTADMPEFGDLLLRAPEQAGDVQAGLDWIGLTDFLRMDEQLSWRGLRPWTPCSRCCVRLMLS